MAKKVKRKKSKFSFKRGIKKLDKEFHKLEDEASVVGKNVEEEVEEIEKWMIQRKKFLVKLGLVAGIIIILLAISHLYLRVKGFG